MMVIMASTSTIVLLAITRGSLWAILSSSAQVNHSPKDRTQGHLLVNRNFVDHTGYILSHRWGGVGGGGGGGGTASESVKTDKHCIDVTFNIEQSSNSEITDNSDENTRIKCIEWLYGNQNCVNSESTYNTSDNVLVCDTCIHKSFSGNRSQLVRKIQVTTTN